jgi:hypothetical protein
MLCLSAFSPHLACLAKGLVNVGSKEIQTLLSVGIHQSGVRYLCLRGDDVEVAVVISWAVFFVQLVLLSLFKPLISDLEVVVVLVIGLTSVFVMLRILRCTRYIQFSLVSGYLLRLFALFFDVYCRHIYVLPHSGGDSEGFFNSAVRIAAQPGLLLGPIYGGFYSKMVGLLFLFAGSDRLLGQFVNVLLGMSTVFAIQRTLSLLQVDPKVQRRTIILAALFPHSLIFSGIFLRESVIVFLVAASTYFLVRWTVRHKFLDAVAASCLLLMASAFHAGVIGLSLGYVFLFMFYRPRIKAFRFTLSTVMVFGVMVFVALYIYTSFGHVFLAKFQTVEDVTDIYRVASSDRGGSAYLTNLRINNFWKLLAFAPLKMLYFLVVPLPHHWRGLNDVMAFVLDGFIYGYFLIYFLRNRRRIADTPIALGLVVALLAAVFIFGVGINNAGTALRHRHKILTVFLVSFALIKDVQRRTCVSVDSIT